ncbi:MAG TPA: trypsin-like serine protease [Actinophytocola sp.]|nr:trypsin-like serine protease [Actinophytocola sp.]
MPVRPRRAWAVLLGVLVAVVSALVAAAPAQAIYKGHDADFGEYRFMVSMRLANTPDSPRCGGTLIEPDIFMTAAHCVVGVPQGGIVATVGANIPDWPTAPKIGTLGHAIGRHYDPNGDNRDDIALVRLATPQSSPTVRLARTEPRVGEHVTIAGFGCTNIPVPPTCVTRPTVLQETGQKVLSDKTGCGPEIFQNPPAFARTTICTAGIRDNSTVVPGDSGGPLLVRDDCGGFRQAGVLSLGSDSADPLVAGYTSLPVEARWIHDTIERLRAG